MADKQCCGTCRWWAGEECGPDALFCTVPMPSNAPDSAVHLPMFEHEGTTCPAWAAKEESDAVHS